MTHLDFLDRVVDHFTKGKFEAEVKMAKEEFFGPVGAQEDDSSLYEHRMAQFLDWYIFDRDLSQLGLTPIESIKELSTMPIEESQEGLLKNILGRTHSLFEFVKLRGNDVYIKDIVTDKKMVIENSHVTAGFNRDEFFEARVIEIDGKWFFCRGFCFHPAYASKYILSEVKRIKKLGAPEQRDLIARLSRMRMKFDQYRHIKWDFIYTNDEKLRI